jgi:hypothetical protein
MRRLVISFALSLLAIAAVVVPAFADGAPSAP